MLRRPQRWTYMHGEYLLDNIDTAQGLADYAWLARNVLRDNALADRWARKAAGPADDDEERTAISLGWLVHAHGFRIAYGIAGILAILALPYFLFAERRLGFLELRAGP